METERQTHRNVSMDERDGQHAANSVVSFALVGALGGALWAILIAFGILPTIGTAVAGGLLAVCVALGVVAGVVVATVAGLSADPGTPGHGLIERRA